MFRFFLQNYLCYAHFVRNFADQNFALLKIAHQHQNLKKVLILNIRSTIKLMIFLGKGYFIPLLAFWNSYLLIRKKKIVERRSNFTRVAIICADQGQSL